MSMNTKELAAALREIARTLPGGYASQICSVSADRLEGQLEEYERLQAAFGSSQFERYKVEAEKKAAIEELQKSANDAISRSQSLASELIRSANARLVLALKLREAEATRERYRVIGIEIENKRRQAERELDAFRRRTIGIEMPADIDTPKASD